MDRLSRHECRGPAFAGGGEAAIAASAHPFRRGRNDDRTPQDNDGTRPYLRYLDSRLGNFSRKTVHQSGSIPIGATGLDKYGTKGPRFGLLAGRKDLVGPIRVKGFEFGMEARQMLYPAVVRTLEQYDPARVRALIATTKQIAGELRPLLGNRLRETPTTVQIGADDILEIAMERGGVNEATVVPYEASAALSMLLLRDHGMLMVHFVGVPPGTADLLIKFVPPETLERVGGAGKYAEAVNDSLTRLGELLREPESVRDLLLGKH